MLGAVVGDPVVDFVGDSDYVVELAKFGDRGKLVAAKNLACRIVRRVKQQDAGSRAEGGYQLRWVKCPVRRLQCDWP